MEKDNKTQSHSSFVETYAGDMAKIIENDKEGLVKKIIHEEEENQSQKKNLSPESKRNRIFMFGGILFVLIALVTLFFLFFKKEESTVLVEKQFTPIIFNDKSTFLEVSTLSKDEIMQTILNQVNATEIKNGGVEGIYLMENKQVIGLRRFLLLIKSNFVPDNNIIFLNDNFLMGVVNAGLSSVETNHPRFFILLKINSISDVFDVVRIWEGKMFLDLYKFFEMNLSKDTNYLLAKEFQDGIVENKNARILYDKDGNIVMMYIFADDNSVIITNSKEAAHEIMLRLASAQKKQ